MKKWRAEGHIAHQVIFLMHDGLRDHHLRVEPRVLRDQPRERPVVVVRPVHHRRHAAGEEGENHEINRLSMSSTAIPARLHCPKTRNNSAPRSPEQRRKVPATSTRGGARRASAGATRAHAASALRRQERGAADAAGRGQRRAQGVPRHRRRRRSRPHRDGHASWALSLSRIRPPPPPPLPLPLLGKGTGRCGWGERVASGVLTARSVANGRDCVLQYDYTSPIRITNGFNLPFLLLHAHVF